jgi:hypothetical protein
MVQGLPCAPTPLKLRKNNTSPQHVTSVAVLAFLLAFVMLGEIKFISAVMVVRTTAMNDEGK